RFPGVLANQDVDLVIYSGEIHALLGENGAGKSTLMNILVGLYRQDEGQIFWCGKPVEIDSPRDAFELGIGMVHQHFMLVKPMTVAENVTLGENEDGFRLELEEVAARIRELGQRYKLRVDPHVPIWQLSVGEQQRVEILKLLYRGAELLILDEPTAVLTPQEAEELGETLRQMAAEGKSVIFITHKLDEVVRFADRVTVLRNGKVIASHDIGRTTKAELAREMVGREVFFRLDKEPVTPGAVVLSLRNVHALSDKGLPALRDISLEVRSGEILGIAGVAGNGQQELAEVVTRLRPVTQGHVYVGGEELTRRSPLDAIRAGVSHIPADRMGVGLAGNMTVADNLIMKRFRREPISKGPFLSFRAIAGYAHRLIDAFRIATPSAKTPTRTLSGGNLQKTILAREIDANPRLLVAVHPTRGLDIGATESVHRHLLAQRGDGAALLLISEDLDELLALADRVAVIYEGRIMGVVDAEEADVEELGLMMAGES
ncbi:MAG: ABC transporter ATP-binding protein, partial [Chloroflexota bacterium]|nr:ABC transporter ATP-binding protein [Chloroflexota bacterium]